MIFLISLSPAPPLSTHTHTLSISLLTSFLHSIKYEFDVIEPTR